MDSIWSFSVLTLEIFSFSQYDNFTFLLSLYFILLQRILDRTFLHRMLDMFF